MSLKNILPFLLTAVFLFAAESCYNAYGELDTSAPNIGNLIDTVKTQVSNISSAAIIKDSESGGWIVELTPAAEKTTGVTAEAVFDSVSKKLTIKIKALSPTGTAYNFTSADTDAVWKAFKWETLFLTNAEAPDYVYPAYQPLLASSGGTEVLIELVLAKDHARALELASQFSADASASASGKTVTLCGGGSWVNTWIVYPGITLDLNGQEITVPANKSLNIQGSDDLEIKNGAKILYQKANVWEILSSASNSGIKLLHGGVLKGSAASETSSAYYGIGDSGIYEFQTAPNAAVKAGIKREPQKAPRAEITFSGAQVVVNGTNASASIYFPTIFEENLTVNGTLCVNESQTLTLKQGKTLDASNGRLRLASAVFEGGWGSDAGQTTLETSAQKAAIWAEGSFSALTGGKITVEENGVITAQKGKLNLGIDGRLILKSGAKLETAGNTPGFAAAAGTEITGSWRTGSSGSITFSGGSTISAEDAQILEALPDVSIGALIEQKAAASVSTVLRLGSVELNLGGGTSGGGKIKLTNSGAYYGKLELLDDFAKVNTGNASSGGAVSASSLLFNGAQGKGLALVTRDSGGKLAEITFGSASESWIYTENSAGLILDGATDITD